MSRILLIIILTGSVWSPSHAIGDTNKPVCDGKGNCITEAEYQAYLKSPDYHCQYYANYIWKESERPYGKKQYAYTEAKLKKIKTLKDEGIELCEAGKRSQGEERMLEAIKIISFTPPAK